MSWLSSFLHRPSRFILCMALLLLSLSFLLADIKGDLDRSLEAFYAAERSFLEEQEGALGQKYLEEGLYYLYRALEGGEERGEILEVFLKGEEVYLLMDKRGELRELTQELFYLLKSKLEDLLETESGSAENKKA